MLIGARTNHLEQFQELGPLPVVRRFAQEGRESTGQISDWLIEDGLSGRVTYLSWKPTSQWSNRLPYELHKLLDAVRPNFGLLSVAHEPENDFEFDLSSQWRAMNARVAEVASGGWLVGSTLMSWTFDPASGRNPDDWLFGGQKFLGIDHYPQRVAGGTWQTIVDYAEEHGLPLMLGEFGIDGGLGVRKVEQFLEVAADCEVACYFDLNRNEAEGATDKDWSLDEHSRNLLGAYARGATE